jgi:hypothetical protein
MTTRKQVSKLLSRKKMPSPLPKGRDFLSSGATLIDLSCTGRIRGAFIKGKYYLIWGGSDSGKTVLAHYALAEASISPSFDDYRLIYDTPEEGRLFEIEKFYGKKLADRLEPPGYDKKDRPAYSYTVEEFYFNLDDCLIEAEKKNRPFIYVLDSMDILNTLADNKKFSTNKNAFRKGNKLKGEFGQAPKAAKNSADLKRVIGRLSKTGSILIILSQSKDNIGNPFEPERRSGGSALTYYATVEIHTKRVKKMKKEVRGVKEELGILTKVRIIRSRVTGKDRTVTIPIYHSIGVDDIGSMIDWLVKREHWKGGESSVEAPEFDFKGSKEKLARLIEETDSEKELKAIVGEVWEEIEKECEIKRKRRYE